MIISSVIIPTLNGGKTFVKCAKALAEQKFNHPWEIVIIDSGTNDGSLEQSTQIFSKFKITLKLLRIEKKNFQHGSSRNQAIQNARGEIICLLTQDAIPANNDWLNQITLPFFNDKKICGVFGRHAAHISHPKLISRDMDYHFNLMKEKPIRYISNKKAYNGDIGLRQFLHFFSNNSSAIRHSEWQITPFPKVEFGEDQLWAKSILEKGGSLMYQDSALTFHSHNFSFLESFKRAKTEMEYFKKYFGYDLTLPKKLFLIRTLGNIFKDCKWLNSYGCLQLSEIIYSIRKNISVNAAHSFTKV